MTVYLLPKAFYYGPCEVVTDPDPKPGGGRVRVRPLEERWRGEEFDLAADRLTAVPPEPTTPFVVVNGRPFKRTERGGRTAWQNCDGPVYYEWLSLVINALTDDAGLPRPLVYADGGQ